VTQNGDPPAAFTQTVDPQVVADLSAEMQARKYREYREAVELAEKDVDIAYEQIRAAGKTAVALLTALGLLGTSAAFLIPYLRPAHLVGGTLAGLFVVLFATCFVEAVWTIRSNIPPRRKITRENTSWLIGVVVEPGELEQIYRERANARLKIATIELATLSPRGHTRHSRNGRLGKLLIAVLLIGVAAFLALRFGI